MCVDLPERTQGRSLNVSSQKVGPYEPPSVNAQVQWAFGSNVDTAQWP